MLRTTLTRPRLDAAGLAELETRWRTFCAAADTSFFQDWTWVGCLAAERFPDPVLLEVHDGTTLLGLALFNRRSSWLRGDALYLHESDDPVLDSIFTEHNGPVLAARRGYGPEVLLARIFQDAMHAPISGRRLRRSRRLVLSGVGPDCAAAAALAGGVVVRDVTRLAPYIRLGAVPPGEPLLSALSRNTRHQIRRSDRAYELSGALELRRAETATEALAFLDALIDLHTGTWRQRGKPGAFATPAVRRFHHALIERGVPLGEVDLLRINAGPVLVGYLLNFRHGRNVSAYQSGFDYATAGRHQKPGLTCHHLAIEHYRASGAETYDFLAGADRYKMSLSNAQRWMHWLNVAPRWHPQGLAGRVKSLARRLGMPKQRAENDAESGTNITEP